LLVIVLSSCKAEQLIYTNNRETIFLKYQNALVHTQRQGCLGSTKNLTYTIKYDTLTIMGPWPLTAANCLLFSPVNDQKFLFSKDSLVSINTGLTYYSPKAIKLQERKANRGIYIVLDGVKHKVTPKKQFRSVLSKINVDDYTIITLDAETAFKMYKINKKYKTLVLVKK
jgi:hypothetical protein